MNRSVLAKYVFSWALGLAACSEGSEQPGVPDASADAAVPEHMSREALLDPETCNTCHPRHYREWASSMHAYASKDPVFLAMNARGQRETDGALGDFCVNCHAPMAVREGKTTDGLNLSQVPEALQGVTCYFCHNAIGAEADHNGKLTLANDTIMRGSIRDPVDPGAHGAAYSPAHDRNNLKSSELCGSCHDVVTPAGIHLERTYADYLKSPFAKAHSGGDTCQGCHMDRSEDKEPIAVVPGRELPARYRREHLWAAVDVALTDDFPDQEAYRLAVECELMNGTTLLEFRANDIGNQFTLVLETQAAHPQPSGAALDRRLWIEFVAYDDADNVIFESGTIADGEVEEFPEGDPKHDPLLKMFRDHIYDAQGREVHMFWDAAISEMFPTGYASQVMPFAVGSDFTAEHYVERNYHLNVLPARVEARLRMRPVGMDILQDLVDSEDLDENVLARMPTFTLHGTAVEWTRADGAEPILGPNKPPPLSCPDDYLKLLEMPAP